MYDDPYIHLPINLSDTRRPFWGGRPGWGVRPGWGWGGPGWGWGGGFGAPFVGGLVGGLAASALIGGPYGFGYPYPYYGGPFIF
ncbi:hypothetical protein [Bacillus testis]|uniref:hypothetical protein n=1 Tax=Bacillus testis TaxID=1622072 RepID=UPI00067F488D|nr:hypothetical protein [Bacillus testis]